MYCVHCNVASEHGGDCAIATGLDIPVGYRFFLGHFLLNVSYYIPPCECTYRPRQAPSIYKSGVCLEFGIHSPCVDIDLKPKRIRCRSPLYKKNMPADNCSQYTKRSIGANGGCRISAYCKSHTNCLLTVCLTAEKKSGRDNKNKQNSNLDIIYRRLYSMSPRPTTKWPTCS